MEFWAPGKSHVNVGGSEFLTMGHSHCDPHCAAVCFHSMCAPGYSFLSSTSCYLWSWTWQGVITNSPSLLFFHVNCGGADSVDWWKHERLWQLLLLVGAGQRMWYSAAWEMISEGFSAPQSEWVNSRWTLSKFWWLQHIENTSDLVVAQADKDDKYLFLCSGRMNQRLQVSWESQWLWRPK